MLTMPVRTLAFVGSREQVKEMEREFPTLKLPMFASGHGADVVEKGNSKADGLRSWRCILEKKKISPIQWHLATA